MAPPRFRPVKSDSYVSSPFGMRTGQYAGMHRGTDFGLKGGAGSMPVYAAQGGTVVYAGAASGFGGPDPAGWVVIDHPTADGSGTTVYGHVIREVRVGQRVEAGDRIARVNPSSASNGGVAPHLHFEVHPTVWRAGSQIDPIKWLGKAASPGTPNRVTPTPSVPQNSATTFGVDVSVHQDGMSLKQAAREGFAFAIIRTTDGTYKDRVYQSHMRDAESAGMVTAAYHYLRNPSEGTTVAQQVKASLEVMGNMKRPIWIDVETSAGLHVNHIREAVKLFKAAGVRVIGAYSYVPYWEGRISPGEPDSHEFGAFWVAAYGQNPRGVASAIYPGNSHRQWDYPLGNQRPALWQFGSRGVVAGREVDVNAFRGSKDKVRALFYGGTVTPTPRPTEPAESTDPSRPMPVFPALEDVPDAAARPIPEFPDPEDVAASSDSQVPVVDPTPSPGKVDGGNHRSVLQAALEALVRLIVGPDPRT